MGYILLGDPLLLELADLRITGDVLLLDTVDLTGEALLLDLADLTGDERLLDTADLAGDDLRLDLTGDDLTGDDFLLFVRMRVEVLGEDLLLLLAGDDIRLDRSDLTGDDLLLDVPEDDLLLALDRSESFCSFAGDDLLLDVAELVLPFIDWSSLCWVRFTMVAVWQVRGSIIPFGLGPDESDMTWLVIVDTAEVVLRPESDRTLLTDGIIWSGLTGRSGENVCLDLSENTGEFLLLDLAEVGGDTLIVLVDILSDFDLLTGFLSCRELGEDFLLDEAELAEAVLAALPLLGGG